MPRREPYEVPKSETEYRPIEIELSPQAHDLIDKLFATGLFGLSREEVVQRFVEERLREELKPTRRLF
jgi:hypothetical protein